jgi:hypothetical protein
LSKELEKGQGIIIIGNRERRKKDKKNIKKQ